MKIGIASLMIGMLLLAGCARPKPDTTQAPVAPVSPGERVGDEIMVCGQLFHTGRPVVLWNDAGGYDAYRGNGPYFGARNAEDGAEESAGTLDALRSKVDQFVIHYDSAGTSENCFHILHERRGLSVHFLLDIDGTIYQTLDLQERAWHATKANDRSIGIEIASIGAYAPRDSDALDRWYTAEDFDRRITLPESFGDGGVRTAGFVGRPARREAVVGQIQGQWLKMYDLTNEQYDALIHLTATLCEVFPEMPCDYPRRRDGTLETRVLDDLSYETFSGVLGHFHVQENKVDPGPAFDWDRLIESARSLMSERRAGFSTRKDRSTPANERGGGPNRASEHSGSD